MAEIDWNRTLSKQSKTLLESHCTYKRGYDETNQKMVAIFTFFPLDEPNDHDGFGFFYSFFEHDVDNFFEPFLLICP